MPQVWKYCVMFERRKMTSSGKVYSDTEIITEAEDYTATDIFEGLHRLGSYGWELVSVVHSEIDSVAVTEYYFKRPEE